MPFLPATAEEMKKLAWDAPDIVLVTGDAYVDHPSFGMALLGRLLEAEGYRVAILAQPAWTSPADFRRFGEPRLFFGVSSGNMDSMINKYTHNRKIRSSDDFSPGGRAGLRPDRATTVYAQRCREAYPGVPVIIGGIEASMRRFAHYDYWSDKVRRSVLLDSKADLLVYGMAETQVLEIARRLDAGEKPSALRDIRGTLYPLGASEAETFPADAALRLPSYGEVSSDRFKFAEAARIMHEETNPFSARPLLEMTGKMAVVQNPPALPLSTAEMDRIYALPFERRAHPSYKQPIPALETVKDSVVIHRGCFGGCAFCSLGLHQGKFIQERSAGSVIAEVSALVSRPGHHGRISDLGAPSANMYGMRGKDMEICKKCRRGSCLHPEVCPNLDVSHRALLALLREARKIKGLKKAFVASGIRMDLALLCPDYIAEIARKHTGGQLKVAPEHISERVLSIMRKPGNKALEDFTAGFMKASKSAGKEQYLVHYFISAHPGSTLEDMAELAVWLKERGIRPQQINDFLPAPMELSTAIYHTGLDPFTMKPVYVPKKEKERRLQRALLQYYKPENRALVAEALRLVKRPDLSRRLLSR